MTSHALAKLQRRIALCEATLGVTPENQRSEMTFFQRVFDLQKKVDELYGKDERLEELESRYQQMKSWFFQEHCHLSNILQHRHAKKHHVLQNAQSLRAYAKTLEAMRDIIGETTAVHIGGNIAGVSATASKKGSMDLLSNATVDELEARIRTLQRENEPLTLAVQELYSDITRLTEEYEKCMVAISKKLLALTAERN